MTTNFYQQQLLCKESSCTGMLELEASTSNLDRHLILGRGNQEEGAP